ncbi:MAG: formylglycine-generating enzyme family protein [Nitrospira sp.]|nr:formylglycine-generating enzyme family protein [Nitrospira sp.]
MTEIIISMAGALIFVTFSIYMLYTSENEAKRLLSLRKAWHPTRTIADESAELTRIRLRVLILYAVILTASLWIFLSSLLILMELSNRNREAERGAQVSTTEETSRSDSKADPSARATVEGKSSTGEPAVLPESVAGQRVNTEEGASQAEGRVRPSSPSAQRAQVRIGQEGAPMVLVSGGTFWMGINENDGLRAIEDCKKIAKEEAASCYGWVLSAQPRHQVTLDPFYLDPYEVTNRQFERFVQNTGYQTTAEKEGSAMVAINGQGWRETKGATWRRPEAGTEVFASRRAYHPVVTVSWHDAEAYCRWVGKRLPTEAEFEYATRAGTVTVYWWGNFSATTRQVANIADESARSLLSVIIAGYHDGYVTTAPVGSYEANPFGLFDMTGNVAEWTADWYDGLYYRTSPERNPTGPSSGQYRMIRGGGWNNLWYGIRPTVRTGAVPTERNMAIGFRCAQDQPK